MHYVIQGEEIYTQDLKIIAKLSQSTSIHRISETAFLLFDAQPSEEIASFCYDRQLDCTWVSEKKSLSKFKLAIFDMDSTLIKNECIDEMADAIGIRPTISKITKLAMQGSIPFQESLLSRIEALAGIHEAVLKKIAETKIILFPGAQKLIQALHQQNVETVIITGGFLQFAQYVAHKLNIKRVICNKLEIIDGKMSGNLIGPFIDGPAKASHLSNLCTELGINSHEVIAVGDGANDVDIIKMAGTSIAFHAKPILRDIATHHLDFVGLDGILAIFPPED